MMPGDKRPLPLARPLGPLLMLSALLALLMTAAAVAGLAAPAVVYPTEALRRAFVANDVVNVLIGLPVLLGAAGLARRGSLFGLLLWPGALLYPLYNSLAYAAAMPFTVPFLVYVALAVLSTGGLYWLMTNLKAPVIQHQLAGAVPVRLAGGVLVGFGGLFLVRAAGQLAGGMLGSPAPAAPEFGVLVADLLITPLWVLGGILLWRRRAWGYAAGLGLLFQGSLLFVGLLIFFLLQPWLARVPFPTADFVVILVMGLIFFIPWGWFARGVLARSD